MLPKRYRASLEGWHCAAVRLSFSSISSITARPPVCSRKCSNALLNFVIYPFCSTTLTFTPHTSHQDCLIASHVLNRQASTPHRCYTSSQHVFAA